MNCKGESTMEPILMELINLLGRKDYNAIYEYLNALDKNMKGETFEKFMYELYRGNGWIVARNGGKGDGGADLLLHHPKTPTEVSMIVQTKNHNVPLSFDNTKIELIKFEDVSSKIYDCRQYTLISVNGYVKGASELEEFNLRLETWDYVKKLIISYDPINIKEPELELFAHNKIAYERIKDSFINSNKVAAIQATGTGKSFLIAKLLNDYLNDNKLVLAPSHYILNQLREKFTWLNQNTVFMTYAKAMNLPYKEINEMDLSLLVLDEFHRSGSDRWGEGVANVLSGNQGIKVFGTSATPIRYSDNNRDMSDELFEKNVAIEMPLTEAIVKEILPMPIYVSALYTLGEEIKAMKEKIKSSENKKEEQQVLLTELHHYEKNWEKSSGIPTILKKYIQPDQNKFIVFCKNKEHLDDMWTEVEKWFMKAKLGKRVEKYLVMSGESENKEELEAFKIAKDQKKIHLMFSIDMLNEGLHIDDVSGVILLRPTESPIIFYQQIGRAIQAGNQKQPLIFDLVNNFKSVKSDTKNLLHDLKEAKRKEDKKRVNLGLNKKEIDFTVYDETKEAVELFETINDRLIDNWDKRYEQLVNYYEEHGNCLVPRDYKLNQQLSSWVSTQRRDYKKGKISEERIQKLNNISFSWNAIDDHWDRLYLMLTNYNHEHGDCLVPKNYKENKQLARWIVTQRKDYKKGEISEERIRKLNNIGFSWTPHDDSWDRMYSMLIDYYHEHGDCIVPKNYKENIQLASWVKYQRRDHKNGKLSEEKIQKLNNIAFSWDPYEEYWNQMYLILTNYYHEHGDCLVPLRYEKNKQLGSWVRNQRDDYKKGELSEEKIQKLNNIGFSWNAIDDHWDRMYLILTDYYREHGDCLVTYDHKTNPQLGKWTHVQRREYKKGKLSEEKIQKLNSIEFSWDPFEEKWDRMYLMLTDYYHEHGDCLVPRNYKGTQQFGNWVGTQRGDYKKGKLSEEKIEKLNSIGFSWDPYEENWDRMYLMLTDYCHKHGDCLVPQSYEKNKQLGSWVGTQRRDYKKGKLSEGKIQKLNDINFIWDTRIKDSNDA